jgi:hypothetical protein
LSKFKEKQKIINIEGEERPMKHLALFPKYVVDCGIARADSPGRDQCRRLHGDQ